MSAIDDIKNAFRKYVADGVPASGPNKPSKDEINPAFEKLRSELNGISAGMTIVADLAARDNFYADADNQGKLVYVNNNNDAADDPDNGVYEYVGGARIAEGFYQGVLTTVQPLIDASEAATASAGQALPSSFNVDRRQSQSADLGWPVRAIFEQGYFDGSGNEIDSATTLRSVDRIPVTKGDTFTTAVSGAWTLALWIFDAAGAFVASTSLQGTKGAVSLVPNDGFARLMIRKSPASNVTPADVVDHDPGIRLVRNPATAKLPNADLGVGSIPRGALISTDMTITDLPIVLGGFQVDGSPNTNSTRASTGYLWLGKGTEITTTDGYQFAENIYDADRTFVSGAAVWRTSLTLTSDMLVRLHLRKSDNSSLVGINSAPWLSIDWVQPAIARASTDIAPGIITPEHLSFAVPNPPAAAASYHIVFNVGESHAAGRGETLSSVSVPAGAAYKFVRSSGLLAALADPTGNDADALTGKGSWGPALADTIWRASNGGTGVILINSGLGSSRIATSGTLGWAEDGDGWLQAVDDWGDALAQIAALGLPVSGVSVLLSIGSNDAAAGVAKATFKAGVLDLYARLKTLIGAGDNIPVNIIQTGPFGDGSSSTGVTNVRAAQRELAQENASIFMATDAPIYAAAQDQLLDDDVHYKQELNDIIGRSAAASIVAHGAGIYPAGLD